MNKRNAAQLAITEGQSLGGGSSLRGPGSFGTHIDANDQRGKQTSLAIWASSCPRVGMPLALPFLLDGVVALRSQRAA